MATGTIACFFISLASTAFPEPAQLIELAPVCADADKVCAAGRDGLAVNIGRLFEGGYNATIACINAD
jgi:hypothetical protein